MIVPIRSFSGELDMEADHGTPQSAHGGILAGIRLGPPCLEHSGVSNVNFRVRAALDLNRFHRRREGGAVRTHPLSRPRDLHCRATSANHCTADNRQSSPVSLRRGQSRSGFFRRFCDDLPRFGPSMSRGALPCLTSLPALPPSRHVLPVQPPVAVRARTLVDVRCKGGYHCRQRTHERWTPDLHELPGSRQEAWIGAPLLYSDKGRSDLLQLGSDPRRFSSNGSGGDPGHVLEVCTLNVAFLVNGDDGIVPDCLDSLQGQISDPAPLPHFDHSTAAARLDLLENRVQFCDGTVDGGWHACGTEDG
jgi:hypothetical protein